MVCVMCQQVCTVLSEVSVWAVHDEPRCGPLLFISSEVMIVMAILQRGGIKKNKKRMGIHGLFAETAQK